MSCLYCDSQGGKKSSPAAASGIGRKEDSTGDQKEAHGNGADVLEIQTVSKEEKAFVKKKNEAKTVSDQPLSKEKWKKKLTKVALKVLSKNGPKMRRRPFFAALKSVMEERGCDEEYAKKILNRSNSIAFLKNKKVELTTWVHRRRNRKQ
eukprot:CAMPEP_0118800268 /NCGR_PEP_ID=MMETSP1161-20130426/2235_1 /TAXON_ID=249345 /ORGANISM="Picochlorum oklahomensis, Strain CCMP2329" /LENGTH=149 /DNA_ID=CAMNT_0006728083 /DNA_START=166 /DNA_END=615 /DNA_ORIENTATION=-